MKLNSGTGFSKKKKKSQLRIYSGKKQTKKQ